MSRWRGISTARMSCAGDDGGMAAVYLPALQLHAASAGSPEDGCGGHRGARRAGMIRAGMVKATVPSDRTKGAWRSSGHRLERLAAFAPAGPAFQPPHPRAPGAAPE